MTSGKLPAIETLRELLSYDQHTGELTWRERSQRHFSSEGYCKSWNTRYVGKRVGCDRSDGYRYIRVFDRSILAHRAIWAIFYGFWPGEVDHINGDRSDNRIANLRQVSRSLNNRNARLHNANKSGRCGVHWNNRAQKWEGQIKIGNKSRYLGLFENIEEAAAARKRAEEGHGFTDRHGAKV